jgi:hypothetical protein
MPRSRCRCLFHAVILNAVKDTCIYLLLHLSPVLWSRRLSPAPTQSQSQQTQKSPATARLFSPKNKLSMGCRSYRINRDKPSHLPTALEPHHAIHLRKQGVILSAAHIQARLQRCPTLPHQNRSARHCLAAKPLHAQSLRVRVAPIFRRSKPFFMCHCCASYAPPAGVPHEIL